MILIRCVGRSELFRGSRRAFRSYTVYLRFVLVVSSRGPHHPTQVLPQVQTYRQDPHCARCALRHLSLRIHDSGYLYAAHYHLAPGHWHRRTDASPATCFFSADALHPRRLLDGAGLHPLRSRAQGCCVSRIRLKLKYRVTNRPPPD